MIFLDFEIRREMNGKGNILKREDTTKGAINLEGKPSNLEEGRDLKTWERERYRNRGQWKLKGDPLQWEKRLGTKKQTGMKIDDEEERNKSDGNLITFFSVKINIIK